MRKNIVKKTLAAAMLTLMACTSMSAIAEPEWVFVGLPTHEVTINAGTFSVEVSRSIDTTCSNWAQTLEGINKHGYQYKIKPGKSWAYQQSGQEGKVGFLSCYILDKIPNYDWSDSGASSSAGNLTCAQGQFKYDATAGTIGCYDYIDCDPSLYARQAMPEACNPKPLECPKDPPINPETGLAAEATTICNSNGLTKVCVYRDIVDFKNITIKDKKTLDIIEQCIHEHEGVHVLQFINKEYSAYCDYDPTYGASRVKFPNEFGFNAEKDAYANTIECLQRSLSECDNSQGFCDYKCNSSDNPSDCNSNLKDMIDNIHNTYF